MFKSYVEGFFHCQMIAMRLPIISQQSTKYHGMAISLIIENAPSHKMISHLTRSIHIIIVKQ